MYLLKVWLALSALSPAKPISVELLSFHDFSLQVSGSVKPGERKGVRKKAGTSHPSLQGCEE